MSTELERCAFVVGSKLEIGSQIMNQPAYPPKNPQCFTAPHTCNCMKRRALLCVLGLVLRLHGLTTAHYKAREPSSVKAAAGWLFFAI